MAYSSDYSHELASSLDAAWDTLGTSGTALLPSEPPYQFSSILYNWRPSHDAQAVNSTCSSNQLPAFASGIQNADGLEVRHTPSSLGWTEPSVLNHSMFKFSKEKEPYFELQTAYPPTLNMPLEVYPDSHSTTKKGSYHCHYPFGCLSKTRIFSRSADLERHYQNVHTPIAHKESFPCDYIKCSRKDEPFTRKDHYRDHLRDFHKEDISYRAKSTRSCGDGKETNIEYQDKARAAWLGDRHFSGKWWRCEKCLLRVLINEDGWECKKCKLQCNADRREVRMKRLANKSTTSQTNTSSMPTDDICNSGPLSTPNLSGEYHSPVNYGYETPGYKNKYRETTEY